MTWYSVLHLLRQKQTMMCMKLAKIYAAYVTADTSVDATNIETPMAPSNSALKTGLDTMLWCYVIVVSTCYAIVLLGGAMSEARYVFWGEWRSSVPKKSSGQACMEFLRRFVPFLRVHGLVVNLPDPVPWAVGCGTAFILFTILSHLPLLCSHSLRTSIIILSSCYLS